MECGQNVGRNGFLTRSNTEHGIWVPRNLAGNGVPMAPRWRHDWDDAENSKHRQSPTAPQSRPIVLQSRPIAAQSPIAGLFSILAAGLQLRKWRILSFSKPKIIANKAHNTAKILNGCSKAWSNVTSTKRGALGLCGNRLLQTRQQGL